MSLQHTFSRSMSLHTPKRQVMAAAKPQPTTPTDSPGNWRHPRLEEITKRRSASVFTEADLKTAVYNGVALVVLYMARGSSVPQKLSRILSFLPSQYGRLLWLAIQLALVVNMGVALLPLFRQRDTLEDIPLTPAQRKLLGLPPSRTPGTPNAVFSTPPRYSRTPSVSGSPGPASASKASNNHNDNNSNSNINLGNSFSGSPISGSPLFSKVRQGAGLVRNGSPVRFSPGSPLPSQSPFQAANSSIRRSSFGSPGSLSGGAGGNSLFTDAGLPGTPSPNSGKRLSMGLNKKWLYEKGRRSSGGARMY